MAAPPPPSVTEVVQLFLAVSGALVGVGAAGLKLMNAYNNRQKTAQDAKLKEHDGNAAEAGRLRDELRTALQAEKDRADDAENEVATWRAAFYSLRDTAGRLLNNALNVCHRAHSELEASRHSEAAKRLNALIELLERVTLPPSPEEADKQHSLRGGKFPQGKKD